MTTRQQTTEKEASDIRENLVTKGENFKQLIIQIKVLVSDTICLWRITAMNTSNIPHYRPKEFAELLHVSVKTLQRWDREKILVANRTPTNRR